MIVLIWSTSSVELGREGVCSCRHLTRKRTKSPRAHDDGVLQPPRLPPPRHGPRPSRMPAAARRDRRLPAAQRPRRRARPARGAAGRARRTWRWRTAAATSPSCATCSSRSTPTGRPCALDPDTIASPGSLARGDARRRRRRRGDRRGDRRRGRERVLRGAPARPPRDARRGDGLLLLQQRRGRGAPCARRARPGARRDRRLRRPPRQRHRGHHRQRRARADGQHLPASALSVQRRRADGHQHGQPADAAVHARAGDPRADRGELDAARSRRSARR